MAQLTPSYVRQWGPTTDLGPEAMGAFMTPACNAESFLFQGLGRREVVARFDGETTTPCLDSTGCGDRKGERGVALRLRTTTPSSYQIILWLVLKLD